MARRDREATAAHIRDLLATESEAVRDNAGLLNANRRAATEIHEDHERLRSEARAIKEDAIERLPELIDAVRSAVAENGGEVYLAEDAADANDYVAEVCADHDADSVVKSKSMTTEEIEVNDRLERDGVAVHETDLGEWVLQVADDTPSHIVGPAMHLTRDEIADLFGERFDPDDPFESAEELTEFARSWLGERIREADVGMTGANFVVADTGTVALVTNEGNARKCAVTPDVHVAVAGVEKLLPTAADLQPFVELIARAATGQSISQYVSFLTPPTDSPPLDFDGTDGDRSADDREFHLVLLDNGRREMRDDPALRETLYCIRCGACSNACSNFQAVGGHGFGGETYSGGIATGWEAGVHGLDSAAEFEELCTGCSRCVDACPVKIDVPWINTVVRDRINRGAVDQDRLDHLVDGLTPDEEGEGVPLTKRVFGNAGPLLRLGSATAPLSNWLADQAPVRHLLDEYLGVDARRALPEFSRETLVEWHAARDDPRADAEERVLLYPDVYTNYVRVERGKAAVRLLEALGVGVDLADPTESGRAPLSQGMIETARERAEATYRSLALAVDEGRRVVVLEPSDLALFRGEYDRLLPEAAADRLAGASYGLSEYVYGRLENGADDGALRDGDGESVFYHPHCQARTVGVAQYAETLLERAGYDVSTSSVECCGMAGSFGYKSEYYELSVDVGEQLVAEIDDADYLVAPGVSCTDQLEALDGRPTYHPAGLLAPRRRPL